MFSSPSLSFFFVVSFFLVGLNISQVQAFLCSPSALSYPSPYSILSSSYQSSSSLYSTINNQNLWNDRIPEASGIKENEGNNISIQRVKRELELEREAEIETIRQNAIKKMIESDLEDNSPIDLNMELNLHSIKIPFQYSSHLYRKYLKEKFAPLNQKLIRWHIASIETGVSDRQVTAEVVTATIPPKTKETLV